MSFPAASTCPARLMQPPKEAQRPPEPPRCDVGQRSGSGGQMMIEALFVDLDGVLVDFVRGAALAFGTDYDDLMSRWTPGCYDMEVILGLSRSQFFATIDRAGEDFWANLPPYPYAREFYDFCEGVAPTYILSSPTFSPGSLSGKLRWLHKWFGRSFRNYIFTAKKEMCARDTHVLIDDHVPNVQAFRDRGGHAILWPTWFNPRHELASQCVDVVKKELEEVKKIGNR